MQAGFILTLTVNKSLRNLGVTAGFLIMTPVYTGVPRRAGG